MKTSSPVDRSQEWMSLKEGTAMKSMLASMAVVLTFCAAPAAAAEFPKTGSAEYDTYYTYDTVAKIDSGVGTGAITDFTGITRNVKGEGPFHDMSVRCLGHWSQVGETFHFNGSCVETDKDGDNVFTTFDDKNHYLMGGTGNIKVSRERFPTLWWSFTKRSGAAWPISSTTRPPGRSNN